MPELADDLRQELARLKTPGFAIDLDSGVLRAAEQPSEDCLRADPLRIMRVLRCTATYPIAIEGSLALALHAQRGRLAMVPPTAVRDQLVPLLGGACVLDVLLEYGDVLAIWVPEIGVAQGFDQRTPWHVYDVWEHTARALALAGSIDPLVRLALLFHDLGKPAAFSQDATGQGHYFGHPRLGGQIATRRMQALRFAPDCTAQVAELVALHLEALPPEQAERWLFRLGADQLRRLLEVKHADVLAHSPATQAARLAELAAFEEALAAAG